MKAADTEGRSRLWVASLNRGTQPRQIPNVEGSQPRFGPSGEIFFRARKGNSQFVYRVRPDGTGMRKALEQPILILGVVSPDGQWIGAWAPLPSNGRASTQVFSLRTGSAVTIGSTLYLLWSRDGRFCFIGGNIIAEGRAYVVPLSPGQMLPRIPPDGFH